MEECYTFVFILDSKEYFSIWFSDEKDGFITDENKLKYFCSFDQLISYASKNKIDIINERSELSFDYAEMWLNVSEREIDCVYFLNYWNVISDLAYSVRESFYGDEKQSTINKVYDKLFWGNNISAVTPEGKEYIPKWTKKEKKELEKVVRDGLRILNLCLSFNSR